jgi:hypothetical protein
MSAGWAFPGSARKCHAFDTERPGGDATVSLCNRWMLMAVARPGYRFEGELSDSPSKSDCAACRREVEKRQAAAA